jgi:RNA polymerase sigma-70 factor (ECF subfamily)
METEITLNADRDEQAVKAVREGDLERYRELVQRHERRVFAVAWSRLGNATLAEDAAQEAFVRGYQRLWLLNDGAKFSAWIAAITRRVAINCGLRHRRELNKRERWALEPITTANESAELCTPEILRQALAELPAAHRECLVLYYLEGQSGAEAATALGISEPSLRVRLHRARAALRVRLEDRLAESLEQLRPPRPLGSGVMGAILSSSSAKAVGGAGLGAKVAGYLMSFKFFASFFWLIGLLPVLLLGWVFLWMERRNYRFAKGFRAQLHRELSNRTLWGIIGMMVLMLAVSLCPSSWKGVLNKKELWLFVGILSLFSLLASARRLAFRRDRFNVSAFITSLVLTAAFLAFGFGLLPMSALGTFFIIFTLAVLIGYGLRTFL